MNDAQDELEALRARLEIIELWINEGEQYIFESRESVGMWFSLGRWWGERPWFSRRWPELSVADGEKLIKDAKRYRKLRDLAVVKNDLEATVALGMFDFLNDADRFDAKVDAIGEGQSVYRD